MQTTTGALDTSAAREPIPEPLSPWRESVAKALSVARPIATHRLAQFMAIGALIFAVAPREATSRDVDIERAELAAMREAEVQQGRDATSLDEEVAQRAIEDEVLYREGLRHGFDRNDAIVRQRVIQKTLFLAEELAGATEPPTDVELRRFFDATRATWRRPESFHLRHVFARSKDAVLLLKPRADAAAARGVDPAGLGEPCPLANDETSTREQLAQTLGPDFAAALPSKATAGFGEPIPSAFGWHLVWVVDHAAGAPATFGEAKNALRAAYVVKRREDAIASYLTKAFADYRVRVDGRRVTTIKASRRLALRAQSSPED